jgi:hypothetical protein
MAKNLYEDELRTSQPQHNNLFELQITGLEEFLDGGVLFMTLTECDLPSETTNVISFPYLNTEIKYAGKTTINNLTMQFRDFCDLDVFGALLAWRQQVWDIDTHRAGLAADYKKSGILKMYSPDWETYIRGWDLKGAWPDSTEPTGASSSDDSQKQISSTLVVDKAIPRSDFKKLG